MNYAEAFSELLTVVAGMQQLIKMLQEQNALLNHKVDFLDSKLMRLAMEVEADRERA